MSFRPHHTATTSGSARTPANALDYEIAQEMAAALGRLGRALERALAELAAFDRERATPSASTPERHAARAALVAAAGHALWCFIVQREACGLRDSRQLVRDYGVPTEVCSRMGAFPAEASQQAAQTSPRRRIT
jgi:hypothetical protein